MQKEMYTFEDNGEDSLTLRPEFTAGIMRLPGTRHEGQAVAGKTLLHRADLPPGTPAGWPLPSHTQWNVEALGELDPAVDFEVMSIAYNLFADLGFQGLAFQVNSIGCQNCRHPIAALVEIFLCAPRQPQRNDQQRLAAQSTAPARFQRRAMQGLIEDAAASITCAMSAAGTSPLRGLTWTTLASPTPSTPARCCGFDYYTKTVFEVWAEGIGGQPSVAAVATTG